MKHLLVSYHTCPLEEPGTGLAGGMNVFLRGLLSGLAAEGIATDVLTRGEGDAAATTRPFAGTRIVHLPCGWSTPPTRAAAFASLPRFAAAARAFLGTEGPYDVVSAHYWMSGAAVLGMDGVPAVGRGDAPFVFMYHTVEARKPGSRGSSPGGLGEARRTQERRLAEGADRLVFLSEHDRDETGKLFPAVDAGSEVIPPGVDEPFRALPPREDARRKLGVPPEAFLFLLAARPDPGKNTDAALAAFGELRAERGGNVGLVVAGQDLPAGALPDGALCAGPVPHARMPGLYAAADAVLCPSLYESFGFVPLEAMAGGVPVILPESGGWGEKARAAGSALTYPAGEPGALARAMRTVSADAALRARLRAAGRAAARPFTWERCAASWARLLSRLATPGSRR